MSAAKKSKEQEKKYRPYERPRMTPWFRYKGPPRWLIMEPAPLAMLGGSICATLALLVCLLRQWMGAAMTPSSVLVSVSLTFVVSYALVGIFSWYVFLVMEKELKHRNNSSDANNPDNRSGSSGSDARSGDGL